MRGMREEKGGKTIEFSRRRLLNIRESERVSLAASRISCDKVQ
jgi:hypothetical protein